MTPTELLIAALEQWIYTCAYQRYPEWITSIEDVRLVYWSTQDTEWGRSFKNGPHKETYFHTPQPYLVSCDIGIAHAVDLYNRLKDQPNIGHGEWKHVEYPSWYLDYQYEPTFVL